MNNTTTKLQRVLNLLEECQMDMQEYIQVPESTDLKVLREYQFNAVSSINTARVNVRNILNLLDNK